MGGNRVLRRFLLAGAAALLAGAGIASGAKAQTKVLRVIPHADLTMLDPVFVPIVITREYGLMVYEQLFAWDSNLRAKPQMVETWSTSPDGLTWRFTLRDGLKFHDGQPVTTADVVASLKRWMGRDPVGAKVAAVMASLDPVDGKTLELKLNKPYPMMLFSLGSAVGQIPVIMRAGDLQDPDKPVTTAIGSGPYRFNHAERISGARVVFDRNQDYVPRKEPADGLTGARLAKADRVEWRIVPDAATAAAALQNGEVDIWEQPALDLLPLLSKTPQVKLQKLTELSNMVMLRPNTLYPPFDNPKARLALAYMIDQGDEMAAGFGDEKYWKRCNAYYICGGPYGTEAGTEDFRPDFDKARRLLAEAGYKGEKIVFPTTNEIAWIGRMSEVAADAMRKAGMNVDLVYADWGTTAGRQRNQGPPSAGGWNILLTGASGPTMHHPLTNIGTNMACDRKNFAGWPCDEEAERLRQAFLDADDAGRAAALDKLHRHLAQVQPYRVLGQYDQPVAMRANVTGLLSAPVIVYWNIDKN
ncbi:ABC transporter substrate-binding protein [Limobrevibacterium gyesilva]|uniref:ABC transporter substrate-binding protein n=1 Tax=Limobrevibacterium gyesilva TaxID=2991712 RepID=A0AA42CEK8_9PROT|nr:ABC transporter substrate-binding protein [Limobrevibacterium gyesilva]MCW3475414.1 ABC transporter substrate-binding protein [Limobrevibacterium gyesilva]